MQSRFPDFGLERPSGLIKPQAVARVLTRKELASVRSGAA